MIFPDCCGHCIVYVVWHTYFNFKYTQSVPVQNQYRNQFLLVFFQLCMCVVLFCFNLFTAFFIFIFFCFVFASCLKRFGRLSCDERAFCHVMRRHPEAQVYKSLHIPSSSSLSMRHHRDHRRAACSGKLWLPRNRWSKGQRWSRSASASPSSWSWSMRSLAIGTKSWPKG